MSPTPADIGKPSGRTCPECGTPTVWRPSRYGIFHGCQRFPLCRGKIGAPRGKSKRPDPIPGSKAPDVVCIDCDATFYSMHELEKHRTANHPKTPEYKCTHCPGVFFTVTALMEHNAAQHTSYRCLVCGFTTGSQAALADHLVAQHPLEPLVTPDMNTIPAVSDAGQALYGLIAGQVQSAAREIATQVAQEVIASRPQGHATVQWTVNNVEFAKVEGLTHKALPAILKSISEGAWRFMLVGPAGTGKTMLASTVAKALGRDFAYVACTAGMSEAALTGRAVPNLTTGETAFQSTEFIRLYEEGGVFLLDEVDAADPNVLVVLNAALANGHMPVPNRVNKPHATRSEKFVLLAAGNTYGQGADRVYAGRNQLDGAFLDRFDDEFTIDYDRELETALVGGIKGGAQVLARVWAIRDRVTELRIRRIVGTRRLLRVARKVNGGAGVEEALKQVFSVETGWTPDELSKVGLAS